MHVRQIKTSSLGEAVIAGLEQSGKKKKKLPLIVETEVFTFRRPASTQYVLFTVSWFFLLLLCFFPFCGGSGGGMACATAWVEYGEQHEGVASLLALSRVPSNPTQVVKA